MLDTGYRTIQPMLLPEHGVSTEQALYFRLEDGAVFSDDSKSITFLPGGSASFDTAMNLFNRGKWARDCVLDDLLLRLEGEGRFGLVVFEALFDHSRERLIERGHARVRKAAARRAVRFLPKRSAQRAFLHASFP